MSILKWAAIVVGGLLVLIIIVVGAAHVLGLNRLNNAPDVQVAPVTVPGDEASLARGAHLAKVSACAECHGPNLEGSVFVDEAPIGYIPAANLTTGSGGVGAAYADEDWARAIRHGVAVDRRAMALMPSYHYTHYGDEDLGALIAYLQSVPPVDNDLGKRRIDFPGSIIFGLLAYADVASVARIDHDSVGGAAPDVGATETYGEYLVHVASCQSCHGESLTGATDPDAPQGPNITPGGALASYDREAFAVAIRQGIAPAERQLSDEMPWQGYASLSEIEIDALWAYLNSLPAQ